MKRYNSHSITVHDVELLLRSWIAFARLSIAECGVAKHGSGRAWHSMAQPGRARRGKARQGTMKQCKGYSIVATGANLGMTKHAKSGHVVNVSHFTGKKSHKSHKRKKQR